MTNLAIMLLPAHNAIATPDKHHKGACYYFEGDRIQIAEACDITWASGAGVQGIILNWQDGTQTQAIRIFRGGKKFEWLVDNSSASPYSRDLSDLALANRFIKPESVTCLRISNTDKSVCYQISGGS